MHPHHHHIGSSGKRFDPVWFERASVISDDPEDDMPVGILKLVKLKPRGAATGAASDGSAFGAVDEGEDDVVSLGADPAERAGRPPSPAEKKAAARKDAAADRTDMVHDAARTFQGRKFGAAELRLAVDLEADRQGAEALSDRKLRTAVEAMALAGLIERGGEKRGAWMMLKSLGG